MNLNKDEVVDELDVLVVAIFIFPDHLKDSATYKALTDMMRKRSQWLSEHYEEDNE
jgi:hypothetical protein